MTNKRKAIIGSLRKWDGVCSGCIDLLAGMVPCSLCHLYIVDDNCKECPLEQFGAGCNHYGSPWMAYYAGKYEKGLLPIDEAEAMYEVICELALEHDIDIDAPGFEEEF